MKTRLRMSLCLLVAASITTAATASGGAPRPSTAGAPHFDTVLYGAAYYNEYTPAAISKGRLEKDVALMRQAGITVVRMGESSWSKWEPEDGKFDFAWMDRIVAAMSKAGIKVIMGTPTYSIPVWMYAKHPDILAQPMEGGASGYGMRQNMNIDDPNYRRYSERIIVALAQHYRNNPNVIGWQLDNETSAYDSANPSVHAEFVEQLKQKYKTTKALNEAWLLSYWGQEVDKWENMPTRLKANSTSYKLAWAQFQQWRATRFIAWQAELVRKNGRADQFVTQNHASLIRTGYNPYRMDQNIDVVGNDIYFDWQDTYNGWKQTFQGDMARSLKQRSFLVAETNGQALGWDATRQLPPYDGQMYQDAFTHISNGANLISYWHWSSIHGGQEIYWKGVLGHDLEPNRPYAEVSRVGNDLKRIGSRLVDLRRDNKVALLYSVDSNTALSFMPYDKGGEAKPGGFHGDGYLRVLEQLHSTLYKANVGTDIVYAENAKEIDLSRYKLLIVPVLYVADDELLKKISDYVKQGGHVIMTYRSGAATEEFLIRSDVAPGPLREAVGLRYQETSTLVAPLKLKDDPFGVGGDNTVKTIAEFLIPETAKPLAYYDHKFFGQWPAITANQYGKGRVVYEGTEVSDALQSAILSEEIKQLGLYGDDQKLPVTVRVKHATGKTGKTLHFLFNYSADAVSVSYGYKAATELLGGASLKPGQELQLKPWGVLIAEEK